MGSKGHPVGCRASPRGAPTASVSPKGCTHCQPCNTSPMGCMSPKGVQRDAHTETLPACPLMDAPTACLAVRPQIQVPRQMSPPQSLAVCPHSWGPKGTCPLLKCPQRVAPITTPVGVPQTMQPLTHILSAGCPCAQAPECPCYHPPLPPPALHTQASPPTHTHTPFRANQNTIRGALHNAGEQAEGRDANEVNS